MNVYFEQKDGAIWLVWPSIDLVGGRHVKPIGTIAAAPDGGYVSRWPAGLHANEVAHASLSEAQRRFTGE